jgi:hypothetical protein
MSLGVGYAKGKQIVNRLRHSYLNVMKIKNWAHRGMFK